MEFESLAGDSDKDGVADEKDFCPSTPEGAMVDENGCPLDADMDGVYDYADDEPNTDRGLNVNERGVGITDEMVSWTEEDTLATLRARMFEVYPDLKEIYQQSNNTSTEERSQALKDNGFWLVDNDKNGVISIGEVYNAIDQFFEGELDVSSQYITNLIDYFFDQ
jgi:hypothetical protein